MTSHDERITAALDADDKAFLDSLEEDRGMFRQIGDALGGPLGGWAKLMFGVSFLVGIAMLYVFVMLLNATTTNEIVGWSVALICFLMMQGFVKEWFFNRMNMLTVLREVKRLQVQVALLSERENRG